MIEKSIVADATILSVTAERIDIADIDSLRLAIGSAIAPNERAIIVVDLRAVREIATQGINVFVAIHKQLQEVGGRLRLRAVSKGVYLKLERLNLTNVLTIENVVRFTPPNSLCLI